MFTGIIEDLGKIKYISDNQISIETVLEIKLAESVSVNGVCLTAKYVKQEVKKFVFTADISKETYNRTNLKFLKQNSFVNLERAILSNNRFSGHFVLGHVDTTIKILSIEDETFVFELPKEYEKYVVEKGSVAIDGISLTVAKKYKDEFIVSVIPYTFENTNLKYKNVGDFVNLEVDILAKYIENFLTRKEEKLSVEFLKQHGFIK
jgi:riboflavin synthase